MERPSSGPEAAAIYADNVAATHRASQALSADAALLPTDLLVRVQAMPGAWMISPRDLLTVDGSDPLAVTRIAVHRSALVEAVRRLIASHT